MDTEQFIIGMTGHLAWPLVFFIFLCMFRSELSKIIQRLAHLKYKDLELDFEKVKQQAEAIQIEIPEKSIPIKSPVFTSLEDQIMDAVERAPSAAILLAWSALESAIASAVSRLAISPDSPSYRSPTHNIEMLGKNGLLLKGHESLLQEMKTLRNKVAHESNSTLSISQEQASNYSVTAIRLIKFFESIPRNA